MCLSHMEFYYKHVSEARFPFKRNARNARNASDCVRKVRKKRNKRKRITQAKTLRKLFHATNASASQ